MQFALALLDELGPTKAAVEWRKIFEKRAQGWVRRDPERNTLWSPGRDLNSGPLPV